MTDAFGGASLVPVGGMYIRADDGKVDFDESVRLESWVPRNKVAKGEELMRSIAAKILNGVDEEAILWSYGGVAYLEMRD